MKQPRHQFDRIFFFPEGSTKTRTSQCRSTGLLCLAKAMPPQRNPIRGSRISSQQFIADIQRGIPVKPQMASAQSNFTRSEILRGKLFAIRRQPRRARRLLAAGSGSKSNPRSTTVHQGCPGGQQLQTGLCWDFSLPVLEVRPVV